MFAPGRGPLEVWLLLSDRWGRRATLVDLYELEAAARGIAPQCLSRADRSQLWAAIRPIRYPTRQPALSGSDRRGDAHEISEYDPAWLVTFARWRSRLAAALGASPTRIDHVGSTAVPGLAAKPVIDIMISVPDTRDEPSYLPACISTGLSFGRARKGTCCYGRRPPVRATCTCTYAIPVGTGAAMSFCSAITWRPIPPFGINMRR